MNKEILLVVDMVSNEKGVDKDIIFDALECALASATKKKHGNEFDIRIAIDRKNGAYTTFRRWEIVRESNDELLHPERQICIDDIENSENNTEVGDFIEKHIDSIKFGRIAAQTARQVIIQKVREAEREIIVNEYKERVGEVLNGSVKRVDRNNVILDLGNNINATISREHLIHHENIRMNDNLRGYLYEVCPENHKSQLSLSRTMPELLKQLFILEVPEINENLIEVTGVARDPGLRAKLGVKSNDRRIDPVGACVGMRGSRVQAVSNELNGERVDIVLWDENPAKYVINAISPAEVSSIVVDEESHSMEIVVADDQLSLAIGRNGQNIKLASELTAWKLKVISVSQSNEKNQAEHEVLIDLFVQKLNADEDVALVLIREGFTNLEEVAYVTANEMLEIEEFDEEIVSELRTRAKDALLVNEIANEELAEPTEELLNVDGMNYKLARAMSKIGIMTKDDLAEQAVYDLLEIKGIDEELASKLIMSARADWFKTD
jgi:N utilization substance protein A